MAMEKENLRENILLGIGNPLLDISANVDKEFLKKYGMKENDAILAEPQHKNIYSELLEKYSADFIAGGSAQNTMRVAQWLLEKPRSATYFGCVGVDRYSEILAERAEADGIRTSYQYDPNEPTGTCAVLITDHHRSLCANLGAANCFTVDHLRKPENKKLLETASFYYVTGFFLTVSPAAALEVAKIALANDRPLIMNLSAPFICRFYKEPLMQLMPYVDVIFGNESEAEALSEELSFQTKDRHKIATRLCLLPKQNTRRPRVAVLTGGTDPVVVAQASEGGGDSSTSLFEHPIQAVPPEKLVDTNGAGDAFVGGFLSQYVRGRPLRSCVRAAAWAGAHVVQRSGCTFDGGVEYKEEKDEAV